MKLRFFLSSVLFLAALSFLGVAQESKLTSGQVPGVITSAASQRFPKAKFSHWSKETEDGKTTYEVSVADQSGKRDAVFSPDGALVSIESPIQTSAIPTSVASAVQAKYPGSRINKAEKITLASDEIQYEVDLVHASKKEVLLSANGKILKEE